MDANPAYGVTNKNIETHDEDTDLEYEVMDSQPRQIKTDDITIVALTSNNYS